jgi:hypothetical protein
MTLKAFYDLVYFTTATTGTGSITVGSAIAGAQTPASAGAVDGDVVSYAIKDGSNYETGSGTLSSTATVLSRDTVYTSSNSGSKITLSGNAQVNFCVLATDVGGKTGIGDVVKLAQVITTGSQTTVDFSSIPAGYSSLKVVWMAQDSSGGTTVSSLYMKINNDATAGDYTSSARNAVVNDSNAASSIGSSSSGGWVGSTVNSGTTNSVSVGDILLPSYDGTTFHKDVIGQCYGDSTTAAGDLIHFGFRWKSTAAINRLTFGGVTFTDGSKFTLYGVK